MRTVGHRSPAGIAPRPSGRLLAEAAAAGAALCAFPGADRGFIPKGVYRFRTLAEANRHREECLARAMAAVARERR